MSTSKRLKLSLYGILFTSLSFHSESLYSARGSVNDYTDIPVDVGAQMDHSSEILGNVETVSSNWRVAGLAQLLVNKVETELSEPNRYLAAEIVSAVLKASLQYKMDPVFILGQMKTESGFNPYARGRHGEIGLMQIKPDTAQWMAVRSGLIWRGPGSLNDPSTNIRLSVAYLSFLKSRFASRGIDYVSAYNMGAANVRKLRSQSIAPSIYANKVIQNYRSIRRDIVAAALPLTEIRVTLAD